ncbi:hypothetical protein Cri9333_4569 [Crinalium epipsammum PCC 9333]|uniref:Uncharacterized protein n=1 Tax=Crinalium epipsammum PCC 9333 TaxID=1173022 RepID=K9W6B6_9CYAN|nr:hypothetical protein [Crinalium epipsammum]AFZ15349.1 hypothetical protein Cri9333_4569 [Crinalium epipsammum PCC 9333]
MTQVAAKDGKAKILEDFQKILAERQKIESRVATKEEEAEKEQNKLVVAAASQYTVDSIVRGLADLQLEFGGVVNGLSTRLTTETTKLDELKKAIAVETRHLDELKQTRVVADALHILTQEHQENLRLLEERLQRDRESLEKDLTETRKTWQREQEEFDIALNESNEVLSRERQRQEADYEYEIVRSRKIATDEFEETKRQIEQEIQQTTQTKEKQWTERERILSDNQALLAEYQNKIATIPTELEEAIKKSREEGIREANQEAKVKADLFEKEWESSKQGYDLQIQALEAKIQRQTEQISEISTQLQTTLRQSQDLSMRAFQSSSK